MSSPIPRAARDAQRVEARSAQILNAAACVFARKGFYRATTREIATEAGVSEGTLYNYFANKEALLVAMIEHIAEIEALAESIATSDEPPEVFLRETLRHRFEIFQRNAHVARAVLPELFAQVDLRQRFLSQMVQTTMMALQGYFERQVALGTLRPVDPGAIVRMVQALVLGLLVFEVSGDPVISQDSSQLADLLTDILLHGLIARG